MIVGSITDGQSWLHRALLGQEFTHEETSKHDKVAAAAAAVAVGTLSEMACKSGKTEGERMCRTFAEQA